MPCDRRGGSLRAWTDRQLSAYRRELERSLRGIAENAPVRELLHGKIAEVTAEQQARQDT